DQAKESVAKLNGFRKKLLDGYGDEGLEEAILDLTDESAKGTLAEIIAFARAKVPGA
ncbi:MAG: hypothetical protein RL186_1154, partial [Pseudomonadota bacterium]